MEPQSTGERPWRFARIDGSAPLIARLLVHSGRLDMSAVASIGDGVDLGGGMLERAIIDSGIAGADELAALYAGHFSLEITELDEVDEDAADLLPDTYCWERKLVPFKVEGDTLHLAVVDPSNAQVPGEVRLYTGLDVKLYVASLDRVERTLADLYGERDFLKEIVQEGAGGDSADAGEVVESATSVIALDSDEGDGEDTQVIRLVNRILMDAYRGRASDIHIEPAEDKAQIRMRIDGKLTETTPVPRHLVLPLVSRLKVMSRLDIAEKRVPQDGAFTATVDGDEFDVRVSTIPVVWGEKVVMRLLNKGNVTMDFASLGFNEKQKRDMEEGISHHNGLVFVTGPTGSGKSTTLYTALSYLNDITTNIMTAEDPVEYKFPGINQVHIRPGVGLTFAAALRSFLRQDPDVIMVGEVRDGETAEICLRAALTGHLVLSTLHTNSALESIARLADMGAPNFLMAATLRLLEAQRLVRKLCPACKEPQRLEKHLVKAFSAEDGAIVYKAVGCDECNGTGYKGRIGLYEVVPVTAELAEAIGAGAGNAELVRICLDGGVQMLARSAIEKVLSGDTSTEEIWHIVRSGGGA